MDATMSPRKTTSDLSQISFIYLRKDKTLYDVKIDVQKVLRESPKPELTSSEFQQRCYDTFRSQFKIEHKSEIPAG